MSTPKRTGRPARISRAEIITVARRIVDDDGVDRLTMRRLATELGITPMALYHHVANKDDLLVLLLDDYASRALVRFAVPDLPTDRILTAARAIHDALRDCPWVVEVLTADDLLSTSAFWFVEQIVDGFVDAGLSLDDAVHGYRAVWHYTVGAIIVQNTAARRRTDSDRATYREQAFSDVDADELPRLAQAADRWESLTSQDTYVDGLQALVGGLIGPATP